MRLSMLSIIPVVLATGACFSLGRDTPPLEQYVLGGTPAASAGVLSPDPNGLTVGLRRLDLTPYLATPDIVVRRGASRLVVSDYHRWGGDPVEGINRAFAGYLIAAGPVRAVDVAPWPVRSQHDMVLQLHISRFEGAAPDDETAVQGDAHILASWELHRPRNGALLARGVTDYRAGGWRVGDYPALVALLDGALEHMAGDIVACMARIGAVASDVPAAEAEPLVCAPAAATGTP
ncbi:MAG: membrane integrity-associated transporter subunit PqiC [Gemmatimonadetes bacterium]|nr:membrane integrity-associated transporter subunit PqiC [Gemmatimonadota bacterium]